MQIAGTWPELGLNGRSCTDGQGLLGEMEGASPTLWLLVCGRLEQPWTLPERPSPHPSVKQQHFLHHLCLGAEATGAPFSGLQFGEVLRKWPSSCHMFNLVLGVAGRQGVWATDRDLGEKGSFSGARPSLTLHAWDGGIALGLYIGEKQG